MEHLTSPKITLGVHCLILRHKGMLQSDVGALPGRMDLTSTIRTTTRRRTGAGQTQSGFGPDGQPVRPDVCQSQRGCCRH